MADVDAVCVGDAVADVVDDGNESDIERLEGVCGRAQRLPRAIIN